MILTHGANSIVKNIDIHFKLDIANFDPSNPVQDGVTDAP